MSGHSIDVPQLYMVAACSLMIAAKMCERETKIPRISAITNILPYPTSAEDFRTSEMMILSFLHWDLNHPTCCYVAELLLQFSIKPSDLMSCSRRRVKGGKNFQALYNSVQEMKQTFFKVVKEVLIMFALIIVNSSSQMLDISITESSMINIVSSVLASAVLQASRAVTGLPWSPDIDSITGHGKQDYQQLVDWLISIHKFQADDEVVVIDEGYLSASINISHSSNINQSNITSSVHQ